MTLDRQAPRRTTVGLFVDWLEDEYQNAVLCGAADAARSHGANLLCFAGGVLSAPERFVAERNAIYELAGPENVDALLVMSGTLGNAVGPEELARFCERFRPLPMCSIAVPLPGIPSVLVDNATGTREALTHLIDQHGQRRIAFVRGPEANPEAERRYAVYREVLGERGLPLEPALVVVGDFQRPAGREAVAELLDRRRVALDAIVAASDHMALGVMDALRARGRRIPEELSVVGFDDLEEARFYGPPLTTVRQPLYEQGVRATEMVLAQLAGRDVPERVILHTELVLRRSCGCSSPALHPRFAPSPRPEDGGWEQALCARRRVIVESAARQLRSAAYWDDALLDAFIADLRSPAQESFLEGLDQRLGQVLEGGGELQPWHGVVSALRQHLLPPLASDPERWRRAEDRLHEARRLVGVATERAQAEQRLRAERRARILSRTGEALMTAFDEASLVRAVAEFLPRLGITSAYLSLYEGVPAPSERSRLVVAYDSGALRPAADSTFPSRQLVPRSLLGARDRRTFVVQPLFFKEEQLGFILFEMGPREGAIYEALRDQISAALKGASLVQRVVEQDQERQRLLRTLEKRAQEVSEAYDALKENQEKLLLQEKMASLGRLTASIAHEMNTPLAAARTALIELEKLVAEYRQSIDDHEVSAQDHAQIATEMDNAIRLAASSAKRAADYVRGIKTQTRDPGPRANERFDPVPYIQEALLLLSYSLRQGNCTARFDPPAESFELSGAPGALAQVVTNLVTNAIDASIPKQGGPITLELRKQDDRLLLSVADQGVGIESAILSRIFEPMFTTKPFGHGTGLGLAIVRDLVTREFGGSIAVSTQPGSGTVFTIEFPGHGGA